MSGRSTMPAVSAAVARRRRRDRDVAVDNLELEDGDDILLEDATEPSTAFLLLEN